jgi:hypothetical protein
MAGVKFYEEMKGFRGKDKYPNKELEEYLVDKIFPKAAEELDITLNSSSTAPKKQ